MHGYGEVFPERNGYCTPYLRWLDKDQDNTPSYRIMAEDRLSKKLERLEDHISFYTLLAKDRNNSARTQMRSIGRIDRILKRMHARKLTKPEYLYLLECDERKLIENFTEEEVSLPKYCLVRLACSLFEMIGRIYN